MPVPTPAPRSEESIRILFVDDEPEILEIVSAYLGRVGYTVTTGTSGDEALRQIRESDFDILFTDLQMPGMSGLDLLEAAKAIRPETEVIILTGYGSIDSAIQALKLGCYDYLQKPIEFERLHHLVRRIAEKITLQRENQFIKRRLKERYQYQGLVGGNPKLQEIYQIIDRIRHASPTVLIQGESGTGKELVANVIHQHSDRHDRPFVPVNCGAIVGSLLESELFGHVKGSFTGAIRDRIGLFKAADGGTIFLDEISEIEPSLQVKLLRALQEKTIRPVGASQEESVDVRIIAASNRTSREMIEKGLLREDQFYRLNVVNIQMPPLREMKEDILPLVSHFIAKFNGRSPKKIQGIAPEALECLDRYPWPGNVRQLENAIERAFALGVDDIIRIEDLPGEIRDFKTDGHTAAASLNLLENEIVLIRRALGKVDGNRARAAELLGINTATIYRKIKKYGIDA